MESKFIILYRSTLNEIKSGFSDLNAEDKLRGLILKQESTIEKAILNNRETGRGALSKHLRECLGEQAYAWTLTQYLKEEATSMDVSNQMREVWLNFIQSIYYIIDDAIGGALELFINYFSNHYTASIATFSGSKSIAELVNRFGSPQAKQIVKSLKSKEILLRDIDSNRIRSFTPDHAVRLLDYPGTRWVKTSPGTVITDANNELIFPSIEEVKKHLTCHCYRKNDAEKAEDLCLECPVTLMLNDPKSTAHVRAEMRTIKELKLPEKYQQYCTERLEHHANQAARFANEINSKIGWSKESMELKFYHIAVAKLYRDELFELDTKSITQQSSIIKVKNSIANEFRKYFPGFLAGRGEASDSEIMTSWAFEVQCWYDSGQGLWLKQQNYERLYSNHHNPSEFLNGLEYLLGLLEPSLLTREGASALFGEVKEIDVLTRIMRGQAGEEVERASDPPLDVEAARMSSRAGVTVFRRWIAHRRQPAYLQVLEALRTIKFEESDELDSFGQPSLSVSLLSDKDELEYFTMLLHQFESTALPTEGVLSNVLLQLRGLMYLPFQRVVDHERESQTGDFHLANLPARYPDWRFPGLVDRHVIQSYWLTPRLWQGVIWSFIQRIKWAWRFYNQVAALIGEPLAPYPLPRESPSAGDVLLNQSEKFDKALVTQAAESANTSLQSESILISPWHPLLIGKLSLTDFYGFLADCGLITSLGELTPLGSAEGNAKGRKAPWVGTINALIKSGNLDSNAAAICRALATPEGGLKVVLTENALRYPSTKSDTYLSVANNHLRQRGLLRN